MLPVRLREAIVGGLILSLYNVYTSLTNTTHYKWEEVSTQILLYLGTLEIYKLEIIYIFNKISHFFILKFKIFIEDLKICEIRNI